MFVLMYVNQIASLDPDNCIVGLVWPIHDSPCIA